MTGIENILSNKYNSIKHIGINQIIFKEGEKIKGVYFIKNGKVKVSKLAKNNITLWFAEPNEFIGLSSFFNDSEKYSFSTYAYGGDVDMVFIPASDFKGLLEGYPNFKQSIIKVLCDRISYTRKRISNVKSQNIKKRFLNTILLSINKEDLQKTTVKIKYSIDEISELTGTSKQYIQKLMKEFHGKKLLQMNSKNSMVVNMSQLYAYID